MMPDTDGEAGAHRRVVCTIRIGGDGGQSTEVGLGLTDLNQVVGAPTVGAQQLSRLVGAERQRRVGAAALVDEGLSQVSFAWLGDTEPGGPHYYAVTGASFLLEYDCVQDGANHVHTVWRDVRSDWAVDVLAEHYKAHGAG